MAILISRYVVKNIMIFDFIKITQHHFEHLGHRIVKHYNSTESRITTQTLRGAYIIENIQ